MKHHMPLLISTGAIVVCLGLSLPADVSEYSEWLEVRNLGPLVNTPGPPPQGEENTPFLSRDGLALYFMSTRAEGFGDADLYVTRRESRGADWGAPQNLGPNVNSADREYWPTLSPDGHRLYFSIWRGGNFDLYVARRPDKRDDFGWEPAVPVAELNSSYDDVSLVFFEDDESGDLMGYFASSRATSPDDLVYDGNIWVTRLQEDGTFENPTLEERGGHTNFLKRRCTRPPVIIIKRDLDPAGIIDDQVTRLDDVGADLAFVQCVRDVIGDEHAVVVVVRGARKSTVPIRVPCRWRRRAPFRHPVLLRRRAGV